MRFFFFFSSRRRHTRSLRDWSSDVCSSDLSGYSGGLVENPSYEQVCTDTTGHAEVVQVTFDPEQVSYEQLLEVFWAMHDPTQANRQGPDIGYQYRSIILAHTTDQRTAAEASRARAQ